MKKAIFLFTILLCTLSSCGESKHLNSQSSNIETRKKGKAPKPGKNIDCHANSKCYKHCYKHCEHTAKDAIKTCSKAHKTCQKEAKKLYIDWIKSLEAELETCETNNPNNHADLFNCIQNVLNSSPDKPVVTFESCWSDSLLCLDSLSLNFSDCLTDCACLPT